MQINSLVLEEKMFEEIVNDDRRQVMAIALMAYGQLS